MKIILEKGEILLNILQNMGSKVVTEKKEYFYIPGWFEKLENDELQFHFMEKLPKDLMDAIEIQRNPKKKTK